MISLVILVGRDRDNLFRLLNTLKLSERLPEEIVLVLNYKQEIDFIDQLYIKDERFIFIEAFGLKQPAMRNLALASVSQEFVWFVDDDVSFSSSSFSSLYSILKVLPEKIGCLAGQIIEPKKYNNLTQPIAISLFRGFIGDFTLSESEFPLEHYEYLELSGNKLFYVPFAQGTSMVYRRDALLEINGFDEDLGHGYSSFEDADPCLALKRLGFDTLYTPIFPIIHHKLPRVTGEDRGYGDLSFQSSLVRNYAIVILKNRFPNRLISYIYVFFFFLVHMMRNVMYSNKRNYMLMFSTLTQGLAEGIKVVLKNSKRVNTCIGFK